MTPTLNENTVSMQMVTAVHTMSKANRELAEHFGSTTKRFLEHLEYLEKSSRRYEPFKAPKYLPKGKKAPKPFKAKKAPRMPPVDTTANKKHRKRRHNKGVKIDKTASDGAPAVTPAEIDAVMQDATPPATPVQVLPFIGAPVSTPINAQNGDSVPQFVPATLGVNNGMMTPHPGLGHDNWHTMADFHAAYGFGTTSASEMEAMTPGTAISIGMYGPGDTIDPSHLLVTTDAQMGMEDIFTSVDAGLAGDGVDGMIASFGTALAI